jgi:hypothetical protein
MNIRNWITSFGSGRIHNMDNDFGSFNMPEMAVRLKLVLTIPI